MGLVTSVATQPATPHLLLLSPEDARGLLVSSCAKRVVLFVELLRNMNQQCTQLPVWIHAAIMLGEILDLWRGGEGCHCQTQNY